MIRIFPDFSVQVTAAAAAGPGAGGGMPAASRVPGATNGNPQNVQGLTSYQQSGVVAPAGEGDEREREAGKSWKMRTNIQGKSGCVREAHRDVNARLVR
ncbi:unnamed protein product [Leuciscus chuanchicus]